ncbi:Protein of unknown function [Gryllus bimaculatus]|nr:Protein of unknown function [Gryllus bimaculatus]
MHRYEELRRAAVTAPTPTHHVVGRHGHRTSPQQPPPGRQRRRRLRRRRRGIVVDGGADG